MGIRSLNVSEMDQIAGCFNLAFSDYVIPVNVTCDQLYNRWVGARVNYDLSAGIYYNNILSGFIITGIDSWNGRKTSYNAATGVIPAGRGKSATKKMYEFLFPKFREAGIQQCTLEVIQRNEKALHVYKSIGFEIQRALLCFGGTVSINKSLNKSFDVKAEENLELQKILNFSDIQPSWENTFKAIESRKGIYNYLGVYKSDKMVGYAVINIITGYVPQFAIHPDFRRMGAGRLLFSRLAKLNPVLIINNIDSKSEATLNFLHNIGLQNRVNQYEMAMQLE